MWEVLISRGSHGLQAVGRQRVPQDLIGRKVFRFLQQRGFKLHTCLRSFRRPVTRSDTDELTGLSFRFPSESWLSDL